MSTIGFVGLGAMGSRIAGRLLSAGNDVYGTDRVKAPAEPLIERGLRWSESPREVAAAADVVFSMVTDDAAVQAITAGSDGILAGLERGKVYVDMSKISPKTSRQIAQETRSIGAEMLDAPVSGSIPQAESGGSNVVHRIHGVRTTRECGQTPACCGGLMRARQGPAVWARISGCARRGIRSRAHASIWTWA